MENLIKLLAFCAGSLLAVGCAELAPLIEDAIANNPGVMGIEPEEPIVQPELPPVVETPAPEPLPSPTPEPVKTPKPKPEKPIKQGDCRGEPYNCCFTDKPKRDRVLAWNRARSGFVWKPDSDHYSGGVFLVDGAYGRASSVQLCGTKKCINLKDFDGGNPDPEGCRHHWRDFTNPRKLNRQLGLPVHAVIDGRKGDKLKINDLTRRTE